jgi:hypothetical protein
MRCHFPIKVPKIENQEVEKKKKPTYIYPVPNFEETAESVAESVVSSFNSAGLFPSVGPFAPALVSDGSSKALQRALCKKKCCREAPPQKDIFSVFLTFFVRFSVMRGVQKHEGKYRGGI